MALHTLTSTPAQTLSDHIVDPDYTVFVSPASVVEYGHSLSPAMATLPGSIMPSDVPSLVGPSIPTTLVMDTESPEAPSSTEWSTRATASTDTDTRSGVLTTSWSATTLTQGSPSPTQTVTVGAGVPVSVTPKAGAAVLGKVSVGCGPTRSFLLLLLFLSF